MTQARHTHTRIRVVTAVAVAGLLAAACGGEDADSAGGATGETTTSATTGTTANQDEPGLEHSGKLAPPKSANGAYTYNQQLAPAGAELTVDAEKLDQTTRVGLEVKGLLANRGYAVHVHTDPCGPQGADAGPHFQKNQSPDDAPHDPAYANPENEIWLDLRTGEQGEGETTAEVPFTFAERVPASVVVHANESTATAQGEAGKAGDRIACLTVPFDTL
ncbi:superoxide dismutase family protein [Amycolatopsis aidingensis]|uniref:superoxide dismutase family protein n=1 Tax=Amycolatopsis aidingensis TaxID=2842453 RepID=UPI001C0C9AA8|nr:superoxide dismutase family protein [Amycolatopsis aidingensis]